MRTVPFREESKAEKLLVLYNGPIKAGITLDEARLDELIALLTEAQAELFAEGVSMTEAP